MEKGRISVETQNIFPIIKKFLYSDQEIFLRELVSNAVDATNKLKVLTNKGVYKDELGDLTVEIKVDKENKTIHIQDKGIGLTSEEAKKYLNQVAFSSATEFVEKYQSDETLIGHFGLGFYSAFMVADKVEVISKSYQAKEPAIKWACEGEPEFTIEEIEKEERGTEIILHISEDAEEYVENARIEELLSKYCKFLPIPIKFGTRTETSYEGEGDDKKETKTEVDNIINNTHPLWKKTPTELSEEDYQDFYNELFPFSQPPLFSIHLNIDYPFNLTGVLYFPKLSNNLEVQKNKIHLYCNQVYVTDEVRDIVPEYLTMLHGVIDSPDIPLNVSRSYLQSDSNVKKIASYISKKVAEKLEDLYKNDLEEYKEKWNEIGVIAKYGMISDDKFYDRAQKFALVKNTDDAYFLIPEYKEKIKALQTDKYDKITIIYTHNPQAHYSYIDAAKQKGYDVLVLDQIIDNHFIQHLEHKMGDVTFVRVDSASVDNLIQKDETTDHVLNEKELEKLKSLFEGVLKDDKSQIEYKPLDPENHPVSIVKPEFMRRMKEMQQFQSFGAGEFPESYNVIVNTNHPIISSKLLNMRSQEKKQELIKHLYDLARLNQQMLKGKELADFVSKSIDLMKN